MNWISFFNTSVKKLMIISQSGYNLFPVIMSKLWWQISSGFTLNTLSSHFLSAGSCDLCFSQRDKAATPTTPQPQWSGGPTRRPQWSSAECLWKGLELLLHRGKWGAWLIRPNMGLAGNDLANVFEIVIIRPSVGSTGREGGRDGDKRREGT